MQRRAFLTVLGVTGYGGLGWLVQACSEGTTAKSGGNGYVPASSTGTAPPNRPPPTDNDEYVPGSPDGGSPVVEAPTLPNAAWEAKVKQLESGAVYTDGAPGPWAGKERSHVPTIIADTVLTNRVTVLVNHVMQQKGLAPVPEAGADAAVVPDAAGDASDDGGDGAVDAAVVDAGPVMLPEHYVTTIYIKTDTGVVAGLIEFKVTDPAPPSVTFVLPAGTKSVTAYEFCNLHGLWASKALPVKA